MTRFLWTSASQTADTLTSYLREAAIAHLESLGHHVERSDLYAMGWDPVVSASDICATDGVGTARGPVSDWQKAAYRDGTLAPEIRA